MTALTNIATDSVDIVASAYTLHNFIDTYRQEVINEYGGMFTSHLVLDEPGRPDLYSQWFDFYFPGQDRFTVWNAEIVTARKPSPIFA
ncbi:MAG: hypothetical protein Q7U66_05275 [Methylobacter sp.]|nr:hypothetical protein [Methylobacter sp.]